MLFSKELFVVKNNTKLRVIETKNEKQEIVKAVHECLGDSIEAKGLSFHYGRDSCIKKSPQDFIGMELEQLRKYLHVQGTNCTLMHHARRCQ